MFLSVIPVLTIFWTTDEGRTLGEINFGFELWKLIEQDLKEQCRFRINRSTQDLEFILSFNGLKKRSKLNCYECISYH